MSPRPHRRRAGFSLVEVSLALLVVAVGMTAVMALFPTGMETNRRAMGDTREALFAEEVISSYIAAAEVMPFDDLNDYGMPMAGLGRLFAYDGAMQKYTFEPNAGRKTLVYKDKDLLVRYALRYDLTIEDMGPNVKFIRLEVWDGEYGPLEESTVFYTEVYRAQ